MSLYDMYGKDEYDLNNMGAGPMGGSIMGGARRKKKVSFSDNTSSAKEKAIKKNINDNIVKFFIEATYRIISKTKTFETVGKESAKSLVSRMISDYFDTGSPFDRLVAPVFGQFLNAASKNISKYTTRDLRERQAAVEFDKGLKSLYPYAPTSDYTDKFVYAQSEVPFIDDTELKKIKKRVREDGEFPEYSQLSEFSFGEKGKGLYFGDGRRKRKSALPGGYNAILKKVLKANPNMPYQRAQKLASAMYKRKGAAPRRKPVRRRRKSYSK